MPELAEEPRGSQGEEGNTVGHLRTSSVVGTGRVCPVEGFDASLMPRLRDGVRAGAPVAPGPLVFGVSFGLLAQSAGMSPVAAIVMSATTFAGSAQFAAGSILMQGGGALAAVVAAVLSECPLCPDQRHRRLDLPGPGATPARRVAADRGRVLGARRPQRPLSSTRS